MRRLLATGPLSLTARLVATAAALVLVVTLVVAAATALAVRVYLTDQLDAKVDQSLQRASFALVDPGATRPDLPGAPPAHHAPADGGPSDGDGDTGRDTGRDEPGDVRGQQVGTVTAVVGGAGSDAGIVLRPGASGYPQLVPLADGQLDALADVPADGAAHHVDVPGLGAYRAEAQELDGRRVVTGLPTADVDDVVRTLLAWEVALVALGALLAGLVGTALVRRQLRPLREVAATAHAVADLPLADGEIALHERVPGRLTDERTEVGQVGAALNTLLEHVATSLDARHRSEQQVRQFVADASHELRTPLATIAGYTELARRRPDDAAMAATALAKVEEEAARMTALVQDLLLLARLDSGRPLEREPVDLARLCIEAVTDARVVAPDHRWLLDLGQLDLGTTVPGDPLRLHQVLTNLLTNAGKYTPSGSTITVRLHPDGFAVHDDGPGFPPDLVDHAFERFARGDAARTRGGAAAEGGVGGVGLGLALVEAIVTAHGGTVTLRSAPGDTTVEVRLPRA